MNLIFLTLSTLDMGQRAVKADSVYEGLHGEYEREKQCFGI